MNPYIIVTPALNESEYIEYSLKSVIAQTVKPMKWMIVDDGSTDETAEVIKRYAAEYDFIRYCYRTKPQGQAYFVSNVFAIREGYETVKNLKCDFDYIAILDADITLPTDYYETIIGWMAQNERLGIASGVYENLVHGKLQPVLSDRRSTPKAIMVLRRQCFEDIGGFLPLQYGGEDTAACVMARMKEWEVCSYPDVKVVHHRPTGMGCTNTILKVRFRQGICEYYLGNHPLFVLLKSLRRCIREEPFMVGGLARLVGYIFACFMREQRQIPLNLLKFIRKEQIARILNLNRIEKS